MYGKSSNILEWFVRTRTMAEFVRTRTTAEGTQSIAENGSFDTNHGGTNQKKNC